MALGLVAALSGCTQNPYMGGPIAAPPPGGAWNLPQGGASGAQAYQAQLAELQRRVSHLDDNNRQLHTQLAQAEQQARVYSEEMNLLRQQLADTTGRLEAASIAARDAQQQFQGLQASTQLRGGATLEANTNLRQLVGQLNLGNLPVSYDNGVVRIVVPGDQLFQPGAAQLQPQAAALLDPIAAAIQRAAPRHRVAIEGHTDHRPLYGGQFSSAQQLTAAQASAVFEHLMRRGGLPESQLFTLAQGTNHPRQTNETASGRAANRRIEIVIHPETF